MEIPRHWRLTEKRYNLIGESCSQCGKTIFPPRDVCPECKEEVKTPAVRLSGKGTVYSYTFLKEDPPQGFEEQTPYYLALIKLEEGPMTTAQLTDLEGEPRIGMPVEMVTRKLKTDGEKGIIIYGYKFRPPIKP